MILSSKKHEDFSIIIPTYNRAKFLKKAVYSVLRQKNVSFEIIIGDNCSTDNTEEIVKSFKDKRIKYFRNNRNLGFPGNIRKCFRRALGKYIFSLGDDDLILRENTLFEVFNIMKRYKAGVGSIGSIYFTKSPEIPCKVFILSDKIVYAKSRKDRKLSLEALDFNVSFFSGLIFETSIVDINKITDSFTYAYFPLVYDAIIKKGIVYIPNHFIVASISQRFVPQYFDMDLLGRFFIQDYLIMMKEFLSVKDFKAHKRRFLLDATILLPSIKLFTNNRNYLKVLIKLISLDKSLFFSLKFVALASVGFLPKFILQDLRDAIIYMEEKRIRKTVEKYNYFQKLSDLTLSINS